MSSENIDSPAVVVCNYIRESKTPFLAEIVKCNLSKVITISRVNTNLEDIARIFYYIGEVQEFVGSIGGKNYWWVYFKNVYLSKTDEEFSEWIESECLSRIHSFGLDNTSDIDAVQLEYKSDNLSVLLQSFSAESNIGNIEHCLQQVARFAHQKSEPVNKEQSAQLFLNLGRMAGMLCMKFSGGSLLNATIDKFFHGNSNILRDEMQDCLQSNQMNKTPQEWLEKP